MNLNILVYDKLGFEKLFLNAHKSKCVKSLVNKHFDNFLGSII